MFTQPISEARLAANRANAQKSTGPRTPEGKASVAGNALKHGLRSGRNPLELSHDVALVFEHNEFIETLSGFTASLAPIGPLETELVERLAQLNLRLNRAVRMETTHLNVQLASEKTAMTAAGITVQADNTNQNRGLSMLAFLREPNALTLIGRYESRLSREFARTLSQFHQLQKLRKQTQPALKTLDRPQHPGTGSSVPSATTLSSSDKTLDASVEIGACSPIDAQVPKYEISSEQTRPANPIQLLDPQISEDDQMAARGQGSARPSKQAV